MSGLLGKMAGLDSSIVLDGDKLFEEFKGALTENFILTMLYATLGKNINYYTFERNEIDFIIQRKNKIIPIEVKAGTNISNISLTKFNEKNNNEIAIRFSGRNLDKSGKVLNIQIFMAEYFEKMIDISEK